MDNHETRVKAVKHYAAVNDLMRRDQAKAALAFTDSQIDNAIERLVKQGVIRMVSVGIYEFVDAVPEEASPEEKVWRAMRVSATFTTADLQRLTSLPLETIQRHVRRCLKQGYIKKSGKRYDPGVTWSRRVYRLTLKGRDLANSPDLAAYTPDPLVEDATVLNRLISTGWALHDDQALIYAINAGRRIMERLTELQGGE